MDTGHFSGHFSHTSRAILIVKTGSNSKKLFHSVPVTNEPFHRIFGEQFADHINLFAVPVRNEENDKVLEYVVSDYCEDHISRRQIIDKLISEIADDVHRARTQAYLGCSPRPSSVNSMSSVDLRLVIYPPTAQLSN